MCRNILILLGLMMTVTSCRSPQMQERIDRLSQTLEELNNSEAYLAEWDADRLKQIREDYVLVLLEEGEYQLAKVGFSTYPDARERAEGCFKRVKEIAANKYSITDKEIKKIWPASRWFWLKCFWCDEYNKGWLWSLWSWHDQGTVNICKILVPGMNFYGIPAAVGTSGFDLFAGWENVKEGTITLPPLNPAYVAQAERGLEALKTAGGDKSNQSRNEKINLRVIMTYTLTSSDREDLSLSASEVTRYKKLPGERGSFLSILPVYDSYQELWDKMKIQWESKDGYGGLILEEESPIVLSQKEDEITVRVIARGYIPEGRIREFIAAHRWQENSPHVCSMTAHYMEPTDEEEK